MPGVWQKPPELSGGGGGGGGGGGLVEVEVEEVVYVQVLCLSCGRVLHSD